MLSQSFIKPSILVTTFAALVISSVTSCSWKGEPVPDETTGDRDTVYNDLTYTAVTGGITSVSAVAVTLKGYANSSEGHLKEFERQGFLLSRGVSNPTLDDVDGAVSVRDIKVDEVADDNSMSTRAYGLLPHTKFYYRTYVVRKNGEKVYGVVKTFMTLTMSIAMGKPSRIGLFDCDLDINVTGIGPDDYGKGTTVEVRYADAPIAGASALPDGGTQPTSDKTIEATATGETTEFRCTPSGLIPGKKYYAAAFVRIKSEFYDYETDNPIKWGTYTYGDKPEDVETDKYASNPIEITATALAGIRSYPGKNYELNYDAITIKDSYFTLPSDTLDVSDYGIIVAEGESIANGNAVKVICDDKVGSGNKYDTFFSGLKLKTKYAYKSFVTVCGLEVESQETFTFETKDYTPQPVDIGLSVLWADRNLGAYSRNSAGAYYAWGETTTKKSYDDASYNGATLDDMEIGGSNKDAATVKWGVGWRMPTCKEVEELYDECEWKWTNEGGMSGYLLTGPNENTIFLPACGIKINQEVQDLGKMGYFWTSERSSAENEYGFAYELYIVNGIRHSGKYPLRDCLPTFGLNIRPVYEGAK